MILLTKEEGTEFELFLDGFEPSEKERQALLWLGETLETHPGIFLRLLSSVRKPIQEALERALDPEEEEDDPDSSE